MDTLPAPLVTLKDTAPVVIGARYTMFGSFGVAVMGDASVTATMSDIGTEEWAIWNVYDSIGSFVDLRHARTRNTYPPSWTKRTEWLPNSEV